MADERRKERPIVIAHRGASGYLPEHTLAAAAVAIAQGADYVEPDVVLSKDGTPIVLHDIYLDTVTNVRDVFPNRVRADQRYYAVDFTLDEIKLLRVNERIDIRTGRRVYPQRFPRKKTDLRVPTLAEWIEMVQGLSQSMGRPVGIYPEIKNPAWHRQHNLDISTIVLTTLSRYGYRDRRAACFLQCFDQAELRRLRYELQTDLHLVQLFSEDAWRNKDGVWDEDGMKRDLQACAEYCAGIGVDLRLLVHVNPEGQAVANSVAREAHRLGLVVHAYTLRRDALPDFAPSFDELVRMFVQHIQVDGLFTDFPDVTRDILSRLIP